MEYRIFILSLHIFAISALMPVDTNGNALDTQIICAKRRSTHANFNDDVAYAEDDEVGFERCENENSHCYTFWTEDINGTNHIIGQGCWVSSGDSHDCQTQCIADKKQTKAMNNTKFCCCTGNMCNTNFTYVPAKETPTPPTTEKLPRHSVFPYVVWIAVFLFISIVIIVFYLWRRLKRIKSDIEMGDAPMPPPPEYNLNKLKLLEMIGQGRYGSVWRGLADDQEVAVKVFPAHHRNYFLNEHELYKEAGDNSALVKCFGGGERSIAPNGMSDYLLILSLEQECLQEYLKKHTMDLPTLARMALGVARGLAHLHSDLGKSCIAHRDLNTRNILVRADLTSCICDLGLAVIPRKTENRSLSEAGTLRYMAPEVLEGAVNLRDCESALKQIDVYSLGLVLWELGSRCTEMQNAEPALYAQPFYKEIGDNPSLEQMQTLVSRHKARPLWPASWKDTAAARFLAETAEDCWDQDAEARLTSLCVEERLLELPNLKGRCSLHHPMMPPSSPTPLINNNHLHDHNIDASVGTIETLLSPSEEYCKNSNQLAACVTPLQPYQGRNPCMERNLLTGSSDSLLIDKSSKHCTSESQNLISNDYLNFQVNHRAMPIPYVQNAVHEANHMVAMPKHNNVDTPSKSYAKFKWSGLKKIFNKAGIVRKDTQVSLVPGKLINGQNGITTSILNHNQQQHEKQRPSTLPLLSVRPNDNVNKSGISQLLAHGDTLSRQRSLEHFSEVFSSTSDLCRLKNPSERVKTPGDVPPSVRRTRGKAAKESSARFSLYDDRMMVCQWGSAPDLDPPFVPIKPPQLHDLLDSGSV